MNVDSLSKEEKESMLNYINARKLIGCTKFTDEEGNCSRCGNCCSNLLPMHPNEIKEIKKYIKQHKIKPILHVPILIANAKDIDLCCPFLKIENNTSECLIYKIRPRICRKFICDDKQLNYDIGDINWMSQVKAINVRKEFFD